MHDARISGHAIFAIGPHLSLPGALPSRNSARTRSSPWTRTTPSFPPWTFSLPPLRKISSPSLFLQPRGTTYVELSWSISPEADLAGYEVYRSEQPDTPGGRLNGELLSAPTFRDMNVTAGQQLLLSRTRSGSCRQRKSFQRRSGSRFSRALIQQGSQKGEKRWLPSSPRQYDCLHGVIRA